MRAILSVSDKLGLPDLGRGLAALGVELVSTGGTAKALAAEGLPVVNVSDVTKFPEMMDGRVKTLHPAVHAGILARRNRPDDLDAIAAHGITPVDLVVVNLYPFARAAQDPDTPFDALVEEIDIGGPSLLRAAGEELPRRPRRRRSGRLSARARRVARDGGPALDFRFELMRKAFAHTAAFDAMVYTTMSGVTVREARSCAARRLAATGERARCGTARTRIRRPRGCCRRRRGEPMAGAPGQGALVHEPSGSGCGRAHRAGVLRAGRRGHQAHQPVRHGDRCDPGRGYVRARDVDPLSAFGGIVGLNRTLDAETAKAITSTSSRRSLRRPCGRGQGILATKQNLRVVTADYQALRGDRRRR